MFEIGNSLHEARVRRSIELVQAELATKIRVKYLRALEDERFEQLPSQTYVKGFLRTYAEYLGLDGQLYVDEYNSRFVAGEEADARPRRSSVRPERRTRRLETAVVLVALGIVAIVTVVVISAWQTSGSGKARNPVRHDVVKTGKTSHRAAHRPRPFLLIQAVKGPGSYVAVHAGSSTGRLLFQGTIEKGRSEPFRGKHFWLDVSSPENLRILVKGKAVVLDGLKPITFTVDSSGVHAA